MNITLKNLKIHNDMSQETPCFSATIYADGKSAGKVWNEGCGGCNNYHWDDPQLGKRIEEWAEAQPTKFQFEKLDDIISRLMTRMDIHKQVTRWCKKQTLFLLKDDAPDNFRTLKMPISAQARDYLAKKYGDRVVRIVNDDIDAAVDAADAYGSKKLDEELDAMFKDAPPGPSRDERPRPRDAVDAAVQRVSQEMDSR